MKYHLFTAPHRCPPCRSLESFLNSIPNWKDTIEYINSDDMTEVQMSLAEKLSITRLPSFTSDEEVIRGNIIEIANKIKELCISE